MSGATPPPVNQPTPKPDVPGGPCGRCTNPARCQRVGFCPAYRRKFGTVKQP